MRAVLALPLTNFAQNAPSSPEAGSTFYSLQHPDQPPLPFNLFPELPLYEVKPKVYVIDDQSVDYSQSLMTASGGPPVPGRGGQPQLPPILPPHTSTLGLTTLWVNISLNPPTNFFLDVFNTMPGVQYGVGAKSSIDSDPFNTWRLVTEFEATTTTQRLAGAASSPMRFYGAVNLDEYVGPRVQIVSPTSGSTVSGDVSVEVRVNDILPLANIEVFVGETLAGTVRAGQGGKVTIPSYWFPNGPQEIGVIVVNEGTFVDTDGDGVTDSPFAMRGWASVPVTFSNEVYMTSFSHLYSAAGSITLDYATTVPRTYTFEVFRLSGELLHTQNGASSDGNINPQWDFTNLSGQPANDNGYVFSLTTNPQGMAAAAGQRTIRSTNFFDKGVTVGKYVISYGEWPRQDFNDWMSAMNDAVSSRANFAAFFDEDIIGPNREAHGTVRADFSSEPYRIRKATQTNDLAALTNALADPQTGSWLWEGHAGYSSIIPGDDNHLTVSLHATNIAALLGNSFNWPSSLTNFVYNRRLHVTVNTGCGTVNGTLPLAVGTPHGVKQEGNPWIKKSAFVGFVEKSRAGQPKSEWTVFIHNYWIDGGDYDSLLKTAVDLANLEYPEVVEWDPAVIGYRFLLYNGAGSW
jgi:hypothetical protein